MAGRILVHDFRAEDVGGHQVGRELHAAGIKAEDRAERGDELRLGKTGNADEQGMAAGENGEQGLLDNTFLAENNLADFRTHPGDFAECAFGRGDNRLLVDRVGRALHDSHGRTPRSPVVKPNRPIPGFQLPNSNLDPAGRLTSRRRRTIS
ncbi:hypothetical protein D9M70_443470 [compost metagenome]